MISQRFFNEVFVSGVYSPVKELGEMDTVLDVGSCTGEFSLYINNLAKHIFAIEPDFDTFGHLKENVSDFTNIYARQIALGDSNRLCHMTNGAFGGKTLSFDETETELDIPVFTLAEFMKNEKIDTVDCLKIDIEEGEKRVFDSEDFPLVANKIKYIIGEHVGNTSKGRLQDLGFTYSEYTHGCIFKRS